jgi:hypothetical protein
MAKTGASETTVTDIRRSDLIDGLDIYVWEGDTEIAEQVARCLARFDVDVIRVDESGLPPAGDPNRIALAIVGASLPRGAGVTSEPWCPGDDLPVIWIGDHASDPPHSKPGSGRMTRLPADFERRTTRGGGGTRHPGSGPCGDTDTVCTGRAFGKHASAVA